MHYIYAVVKYCCTKILIINCGLRSSGYIASILGEYARFFYPGIKPIISKASRKCTGGGKTCSSKNA